MTNSIDSAPLPADAPEISLLEARFQASGRLPCKIIDKRIRTMDKKTPLCLSLKYVFVTKDKPALDPLLFRQDAGIPLRGNSRHTYSGRRFPYLERSTTGYGARE
jgi:hypothetical protein